MKSFCPLSTQSSPSRVAREVRLPASEPVSGSVSPKQPSAARGRELGQPLLLLLLGAEEQDRLADQSAADRHDAAQRGVGPAELLHGEGVGDVVAAEAAVLLGDGQAEEADLGHLGHDREVDGLVAVPPRAVRDRLASRKSARQVAEGLLLVGQGEVHQPSASTVSWSVTPAARRREVVVAVAEQVVERGEVAGVAADGVLRGHPDAAVQLDRLLADVPRRPADLQAARGRPPRRRRSPVAVGEHHRRPVDERCGPAPARRTCPRRGTSAPGTC